MYRAPDTKPHCKCCDSANVTAPTQFDPSDGWVYLRFRDAAAKPGIFSASNLSIPVDRARVCVDCGNVMLALSAHKLEELRAALPHLQPLPGG